MKLQTVVRDCLFLNWALPASALPEPPSPLRYQRHEWHGADHVFVSAQLFHLDAVRWSAMPLPRVGYPQLSVRLCVLDGEGVPSVLFLRARMPAWVAPGARLLSYQPAASAWLDFPRPTRGNGRGDSWCWRARRGGTFTVQASLHSPHFGEGPRLGSWDETVQYVQDRPRGYAEHGGVLHRVDASHAPAGTVWPLAAEVRGDADLLPHLLPPGLPALPPMPSTSPIPPHAADPEIPRGGRNQQRSGNGHRQAAAPWPEPHSAWLCPEMPLVAALNPMPRVHQAVAGLPHPAAGRVSVAAFWARPDDASPRPAAVVAAALPPRAGEMGPSRVLASAA
jgi:hypothetical protein